MMHLQPYCAREIHALPLAREAGWQLKRYAVLAEGRQLDSTVAEAATRETMARLPAPGDLSRADGNHGIGFQIVHFAETAVVSPSFYWQWGSVLSRIPQIKADWANPTVFGDGVAEILGCVWEMEVVAFEMAAWRDTMLADTGTPEERLARYLIRSAA